MSKVTCTGSCKESVLHNSGGRYTDGGRTVVHHPNAICHYLEKNKVCTICTPISADTTTDWEKEWLDKFTNGLPTIVTQNGVTSLHPDFCEALKTFLTHRDTALWEAIEGLKEPAPHIDSNYFEPVLIRNTALSLAQALIPNGREV